MRDLHHHTQTCSKGETKVVGKNQQVEVPKTAFKQAFFPDKEASASAIFWRENESRWWRMHIHHARCGHGGVRWISNGPMDGLHLPSKTVFQFHGCFYHGCLKYYPDHEQFLAGGKKAKDLFEATKNWAATIRREGFTVVEKWLCEYAQTRQNPKHSQKPIHTRSFTISKQSVTRTNGKIPPIP